MVYLSLRCAERRWGTPTFLQSKLGMLLPRLPGRRYMDQENIYDGWKRLRNLSIPCRDCTAKKKKKTVRSLKRDQKKDTQAESFSLGKKHRRHYKVWCKSRTLSKKSIYKPTELCPNYFWCHLPKLEPRGDFYVSYKGRWEITTYKNWTSLRVYLYREKDPWVGQQNP